MQRSIRLLFYMSLVGILLAGCKEVIHSDIREREANEIVAVLHAWGINSRKEPIKGGTYSVTVPRADFGAALAILSRAGLPREPFKSVGDVFPDSRVVGTPFEQRVRFAFALSQELSGTLTEIEGVHLARVHIMIADQGRFQNAATPSTASLVIYHSADFEPGYYVPQMKKLVAFAVPNLAYDDVSVALFPAGGMSSTVIGGPARAFAADASPTGTPLHRASYGTDIPTVVLFIGACLAFIMLIFRITSGARVLLRRLFSHVR